MPLPWGIQYPFSNGEIQNLDWIISKVQELNNKIENDLDKMIREQLDKLFIDAMYDPDTETLILILGMEE